MCNISAVFSPLFYINQKIKTYKNQKPYMCRNILKEENVTLNLKSLVLLKTLPGNSRLQLAFINPVPSSSTPTFTFPPKH